MLKLHQHVHILTGSQTLSRCQRWEEGRWSSQMWGNKVDQTVM